MAVSVTLACEQGSLPVAWQLYLPHVCAEDVQRRLKAGVPEDLEFATKPQIALHQLRSLLAQGAPRHCVLADAGLRYRLCISSRPERTWFALRSGNHFSGRSLASWFRAIGAQAIQRHGASPCNAKAYGQPVSVKALAPSLPQSTFQSISWRENTNERLSSRLAELRVHCAGGNAD